MGSVVADAAAVEVEAAEHGRLALVESQDDVQHAADDAAADGHCVLRLDEVDVVLLSALPYERGEHGEQLVLRGLRFEAVDEEVAANTRDRRSGRGEARCFSWYDPLIHSHYWGRDAHMSAEFQSVSRKNSSRVCAAQRHRRRGACARATGLTRTTTGRRRQPADCSSRRSAAAAAGWLGPHRPPGADCPTAPRPNPGRGPT